MAWPVVALWMAGIFARVLKEKVKQWMIWLWRLGNIIPGNSCMILFAHHAGMRSGNICSKIKSLLIAQSAGNGSRSKLMIDKYALWLEFMSGRDQALMAAVWLAVALALAWLLLDAKWIDPRIAAILRWSYLAAIPVMAGITIWISYSGWSI